MTFLAEDTAAPRANHMYHGIRRGFYFAVVVLDSDMPPYFETVKSFADVPFTEDGVATAPFLDASDGLLQMFDLIGSSAVFGFVQSDIRGNIEGVRTRYMKVPDESRTLEALVRAEISEGERRATPSLTRLVRGLLFTCRALQNMQRDTAAELNVCFRRSYDEVLRHHHGVLIRSVVAVALHAVPRRNDFYARIAQGGAQDKLDVELARWLEGLDRIVRHLSNFLESGGYGRV